MRPAELRVGHKAGVRRIIVIRDGVHAHEGKIAALALALDEWTGGGVRVAAARYEAGRHNELRLRIVDLVKPDPDARVGREVATPDVFSTVRRFVLPRARPS